MARKPSRTHTRLPPFYRVNMWLRGLSYVTEIPLFRWEFQGVPLQLYVSRGQPGIAGPSIVHSEGTGYALLRNAFLSTALYDHLRERSFSLLMLGGGLGSACALLVHHGCVPEKTIVVDTDPVIPQLWKQWVHPYYLARVDFYKEDARQFLWKRIRTLRILCSLIVLDVCTDRKVPAWIYQEEWLQQMLRIPCWEFLYANLPEYGHKNASSKIQTLYRTGKNDASITWAELLNPVPQNFVLFLYRKNPPPFNTPETWKAGKSS